MTLDGVRRFVAAFVERAVVPRSVATFIDRAFVPREVFFRSGDRFRHLRFTVRAQRIAACGAVLVIAWSLYATGSYVVHRVLLAGKDREIAQHKLAYLDLLAEVGEYHDQFSRITKDLEDNQAYLLSLLEQTPGERKDLATIQGRLKNSETEHARVMIAREGLRAKMRQFEGELLEIAGQNITLQSQLAHVRDMLESSRAERDEVAAARERLVDRLSELEGELTRLSAAKQGLEGEVAALGRKLDTSEAAGRQLQAQKARLNARVAGLEQDLGAAFARRAELEERISGLSASLARASDQGEALRQERDVLERRVGGLEQRLIALREAEHSVIERLNERARLSVDVMERTVAMTGLDVEVMISDADTARPGQGGPFVPAAEAAPGQQLASTVDRLDRQLDRWSALQDVMAALPLTAPLDQYRISSGYGERRDPVNRRKARHHGVDFVAPMRSAIYATAPGRVVFAGWRGRYGRVIELDHGHGIRTRYAHLRKILVKAGDEVEHHQKIGLLGSSGRSTGPHVHYEVRYRAATHNPLKFLKAGRYVFKE